MLVFAHYYYPDIASTGQILTDLCRGMLNDFVVTVICVVPSYEGTIEEKYKDKPFYYETLDGVNIIRIRVPEFDKKNKISRIKNILAYYFGAKKACNTVGAFDYVLTISQPPILGGLLGVYAKKKKKAKLIYNIQDFNPEQVIAVGYSKSELLLRFLMMLDKKSCKKSDLIITVGRDLGVTLENRFKNKKVPNYKIINNWIDETQVRPLKKNNKKVLEFLTKHELDNKFIIMYSGNIGLYYDLMNIIKVIEQFPEGTKAKNGKDVCFVFVGAGSVLNDLKQYVKNKNMKNVRFLPYQNKEELIFSLNAADVHWCINAKGIKGVSCPSKAYGIMAVGKPMLGCLENESEIRCIIEDSGCGLCSTPGDYKSIDNNINIVLSLDDNELKKMGMKGRQYLEEHLSKEVSILKYIDAIESI